jgi:hypothetical protein
MQAVEDRSNGKGFLKDQVVQREQVVGRWQGESVVVEGGRGAISL